MKVLCKLCLVLTLATPVSAAEIIVNSGADSGAGTLRDAIMQSNASVGEFDTIVVAWPPAGELLIEPTSELPAFIDPFVFDGKDETGTPRVAVLGRGLVIGPGADGSIVRGVRVAGAGSADGISILGANNVTIDGCRSGSTADGSGSEANRNGLRIENSNNTVILNSQSSGNTYAGLFITGESDGTIIQGSLLGVTLDRQSILRNGTNVILDGEGVRNTMVGGHKKGQGNIIANARDYGIDTEGESAAGEANAWMSNFFFGNQVAPIRAAAGAPAVPLIDQVIRKGLKILVTGRVPGSFGEKYVVDFRIDGRFVRGRPSRRVDESGYAKFRTTLSKYRDEFGAEFYPEVGRALEASVTKKLPKSRFGASSATSMAVVLP